MLDARQTVSLHIRAQELFLRALSMPGTDRDAFVRKEASGSPPLLEEVTRLLGLASTGPSFPTLSLIDAGGLVGGTRIAEYEIVRLLGAGGMGQVFLARGPGQNASSETDVALKVLRPGLISSQIRQRFEREASIQGRLDHPGIARLYTAGWTTTATGELGYLAMEYVKGLPLLEHASQHDLDERARLELLHSVCEAVAHAHEQGVVHRDLKPANILVNEAGRPKILDFGLARSLDPAVQNASQVTASGILIGTLRYMSPEQARADADKIGPPSDVYALGVIGFELLSGRLPYEIAGEETLPRVIAAILDARPRMLSHIRGQKNTTLDAIFDMALDADPDGRYATAHELAADLQRCLRGARAVASLRRRGMAKLKRRMSKEQPVRAVVLGAVFALVAVVMTVAILRVGARASAGALESVYQQLADADAAIHFGETSDEDLVQAIGSLQGVRSKLAGFKQDDFVGHLRRYTSWRLGECHYLLAAFREDASEADRAFSYWQECADLPFDLDIGDRLPESWPSRKRLMDDGRSVPNGGKGMAKAFLASFHRPLTNWRDSLHFRRQARRQFDQPGNYVHRPEGGPAPRHRAFINHDLAGSIVGLAGVTNDRELVAEAIDSLRTARNNDDFRAFTDAYAAYLRTFGIAYTLRAHIDRNPADCDSALVELQLAKSYLREPNGGAALVTQLLIAKTWREKATLEETPDRRLADLDQADEALGPVRNHAGDLGRRSAIDLDVLAASLHRLRAESLLQEKDVVGAVRIEQYIVAASRGLAQADSVLRILDYAVPRSKVLAEKAELCALEWRWRPSPEARRAFEAALDEAEAAVPQGESPVYHERLAELERTLLSTGG